LRLDEFVRCLGHPQLVVDHSSAEAGGGLLLTLDGMTAAAQDSRLSDIAAAVDWLTRQTSGNPVILEAASDEKTSPITR
jgi:uncharacterized membrane protein